MESYFNAQKGKYNLLKLPKRIAPGGMPKTYAIDLKTAEIEPDNWPLSEEFIERVCLAVADDKQVILLLNRRGYAGILMCQACGHIDLCPECRISLTFHKPDHKLICHYCGYSEKAPESCPDCSGAVYEYRGIGTQRLEELFTEILGEKGIIRMDSDSTTGKGNLEKIISSFELGKIPILLGTKMVAKGHHFPNVGLVGAVLADAGLQLPDFRSTEKVFQLLVQAAGRAGRSLDDKSGEFIIQTYDPNSGILKYAAEQNYDHFYQSELPSRKQLGYPPYGKLIRLIFSGDDQGITRKQASYFANQVRSQTSAIQVLGPAVTGIFRLKNKYHYQVVLKGRFTSKLKAYFRQYIENHSVKGTYKVSIKIDVDPREMV